MDEELWTFSVPQQSIYWTCLTGVRLDALTVRKKGFVGFLRHNMTAPTARHLDSHSQ